MNVTKRTDCHSCVGSVLVRPLPYFGSPTCFSFFSLSHLAGNRNHSGEVAAAAETSTG